MLGYVADANPDGSGSASLCDFLRTSDSLAKRFILKKRRRIRSLAVKPLKGSSSPQWQSGLTIDNNSQNRVGCFTPLR